MQAHLTPSPPVLMLLTAATAAGYLLATAGMKRAAVAVDPMAVSLAVAGFAVAFLAEMVLLRAGTLAAIYLAIVAAETILVLGYAMVLGETPGPRQLLGAGLVVAGIALTLR